MFLIGKKKKLLNALGLVYGYLCLEGRDKFSVIDIETAGNALNQLVQTGEIDREEVDAILVQMRTAGVAPTLKAVFELALQAEVPEGFVPSFRFVLHECGMPLPHGVITAADGGASDLLMTLVEGLEYLVKWVEGRDVSLHELDGVYLLKEMVAAKLPVDEADAKSQYEALPQDVRDQLQAKSPIRDLGLFSLPGLGDVLVMEIRLPSGRGQQASAK